MVDVKPGLRVVTVLCLSALLALVPAACGDSEDSSSSEGSAAAESDGGDATATGLKAAQAEVEKLRAGNAEFTPPGPQIDAAALKGKSIAYVTLSASIPALNGNALGIKEAAESLGLKYNACDGKFTPAAQSACIKQAVNAKPVGIITNAVDPATVKPAMKAAADAKIPIMALSTDGTESEVLRFIGNGDVESQAAAMNWIIADSKGKANILAVTLNDSVQVKQSAASGKTTMEKNCPGCKYETVEVNGGQLASVPSLTASALLKNPNANYGFPQFDFNAPDFQRGVRQAGRVDKMKMISTNATTSQVQEIKDGGFQVADAGVNANYIGWETMDGMLRLLLKEPAADNVTAPIRIFDETNVASIKLDDATQQTGEWWGPTTYKQEFPKLWGAG